MIAATCGSGRSERSGGDGKGRGRSKIVLQEGDLRLLLFDLLDKERVCLRLRLDVILGLKKDLLLILHVPLILLKTRLHLRDLMVGKLELCLELDAVSVVIEWRCFGAVVLIKLCFRAFLL